MSDSSLPTVSIIIVNYNTTQLTLACIASIYQHTKEVSFEIIVIDNASKDNTIEEVLLKYPDTKLLCNTVNQGFGRANNQGMAIARGEFLFLLNSDTLLCSDAPSLFTQFMRAAGHERVGVCGGALFTGTEKSTPSYGNFPSWLYLVSSIGFSYLYRDYYRKHIDIGVANEDEAIREVDFISGADMFIRASVIKEVGGFDPDFFLYFEETELSYRIHKAGYQAYILPAVRILHYEGGSAATETNETFNYQSFSHYCKGRQLFYRKAYGDFYAALAKPWELLYTFIRSVLGRQPGDTWKKMGIVLRA